MSTIGVMILYNRPHYLQKVVKSLEQNTVQLEWLFFQDGPKLKETEKCKEVIQQSNLKGELHQTIKNISPLGQNLRILPLYKQYDNVFVFEDDMIVSPYYIELILKLNKQFPNSLIFSPDYPKKPKPDKNLINKLGSQPWNLWGYLLPSSIGRRIEPYIEEYKNFLLEHQQTSDLSRALKSRPHDLIRKKYGVQATGIDAIIHKAITRIGANKVNTLLPRSRYIGKYGIQQNPKIFDQKFVEQQYIFEKDQQISKFEFLDFINEENIVGLTGK